MAAVVEAQSDAKVVPSVAIPDGWSLAFSDEFSGDASSWIHRWTAFHAMDLHVRSVRRPSNLSVEGGLLRLFSRRDWMSPSKWSTGGLATRQRFQYGYFECRYRYAGAPGVNNSFWIATRKPKPAEIEAGVTGFEIDVNEGHYPNKITSNLHRWSRGGRSDIRSMEMGGEAAKEFRLPQPIRTSRLRVISWDYGRTSIGEVRAYAPSTNGYPALLDAEGVGQTADNERNLVFGATARATSQLRTNTGPELVVDGDPRSPSRWVTRYDSAPPQWVDVFLTNQVEIGCVQVLSGWRSGGEWRDTMGNFSVYAFVGEQWVEVGNRDARSDLSREFSTHSLLWTPSELVFYVNGQMWRRQTNDFAHAPAAVLLSSAVIRWAGPETDRIDGTSMDVDYVRVWQPPQEGNLAPR